MGLIAELRGRLQIAGLAVALVLTLIANQSWADNDFDDAVALWLDGDDAASLPMLAGLAADGHGMARLLLARIETRDLGPSPYRIGLTRTEAQALFRAPADGAAFAPTWLQVETAAGSPLASALLATRSADPNPQLIRDLAFLGEPQATDHPTRIAALYGTTQMRAALAGDPVLLPELQPYLAYLSGPPEPRGDGLAALRHMAPASAATVTADEETLDMAGILALGYPYGDMHPANRWRESVENWVMSAPQTRPIADLCRAHCSGPYGPAQCGFAMLAFTGGYYEVIRTDSPLESAVPQAQFLASPRARLMALRRVVLVRRETNLDWLAAYDDVRSVSLCAAELVRTERGTYKDVLRSP